MNPYLNGLSDISGQPFFNQDVNRIQRQNNISMMPTNSNLQPNSSNSLTNLINALNRSGHINSNGIPNYNNTFDTINTINNSIPINNRISQNTIQQQPSNLPNSVRCEVKPNINYNEPNYSNLKLLLSSNQNPNVNSNVRKDIMQNNSLNQNINQKPKSTNYDPSILHSLFPAPHFTTEMLSKVNLEASYSEEKNGYDLPFSDIATLRFFYNIGIRHFKNIIAKHEETKNSIPYNNNLISLLNQNNFRGHQEVSNDQTMQKINTNSFSQNIKSTNFQNTPEYIETPILFRNGNSSNNIYANNLSLNNRMQSNINQKNAIELLQQQQMNLRDDLNSHQRTNYPIQYQSVVQTQQKIVSEPLNFLQSHQRVLNEPSNFDNTYQRGNIITNQQNMSISMYEASNNIEVRRDCSNDKTSTSSNETNSNGNISEKKDTTPEIKQEAEDDYDYSSNFSLNNEENEVNKLSPSPSSSPEVSNDNDLTNNLNSSTSTAIESDDFLNHSMEIKSEFTKQFPVCIIQRVSDIVNILNNDSRNKITNNKSDDDLVDPEEFKDTIDYQEEILGINENRTLQQKIHENGKLTIDKMKNILNNINSLSEIEELSDDLTMESTSSNISNPSKRPRQPSLEKQLNVNNLSEFDNNPSLKDDSIKQNGVKRFKESNSDSDTFYSNCSSDKNLAKLPSKSISKIDNSGEFLSFLINSNSFNDDDVATLLYSDGKYSISSEKINILENTIDQSRFGEVCSTKSGKENEDFGKISNRNVVESETLRDKKTINLNINNIIVSPFIDSYISYIKNEFLRQLRKKRRSQLQNRTPINLNTSENNISISLPQESSSNVNKVQIYNSSNQERVEAPKNITENISLLESVQNFPRIQNTSVDISNNLQPNQIPSNISESFFKIDNSPSKIHYHIALQRSSELEELLKGSMSK
uniref:HSF_DOMAIN domain-containing protein n=1 Tax=Strongyloides papillosus TaxID=174720 RepID=A0A0N5C2D4_STREA